METERDERSMRLLELIKAGDKLGYHSLRQSFGDPDRPFVLDFSGVILCGLDLSGFTFDFHMFMGAFFCGSNLRGASFVGAELTGVDFRGANLEDTDFDDAYMRGVDLRGARGLDSHTPHSWSSVCSGLSSVKGLPPGTFADAVAAGYEERG